MGHRINPPDTYDGVDYPPCACVLLEQPGDVIIDISHGSILKVESNSATASWYAEAMKKRGAPVARSPAFYRALDAAVAELVDPGLQKDAYIKMINRRTGEVTRGLVKELFVNNDPRKFRYFDENRKDTVVAVYNSALWAYEFIARNDADAGLDRILAHRLPISDATSSALGIERAFESVS